eukprot:6696397-Pyramimonas_sp.AAC.1
MLCSTFWGNAPVLARSRAPRGAQEQRAPRRRLLANLADVKPFVSARRRVRGQRRGDGEDTEG